MTEEQIARLEKAIKELEYKTIWCSKAISAIEKQIIEKRPSWSFFRALVVILLILIYLSQIVTCAK